MRDDWWPWLLRLLWVALPFTLGVLIGDAAADTSRPVQLTVTIGVWIIWAFGLLFTLVPHPATLTPMRIVAPATLVAAMWSTAAHEVSGWAVASLAVTAAAGLVALSPVIGAWFINGSSYGDERRIPLRAPGPLLAGPIPVAWAILVAATSTAPLLLATRQWVGGAIVSVLALGSIPVAGKALHSLSRRWLVFVPAGVVIHDHMTVPDPVLFKRPAVRAFGPALADTDAADLTLGAPGLALEIQIREPVELAYRARSGDEPTTREVDAVVISPSRPGVVLDEARRRRITVG